MGRQIELCQAQTKYSVSDERLKGAGMRWDKDNAEAVTALAGLYSSHLWETYWNIHTKAA
ncbi:MAG: hypothetical protein GY809_06840 [Planctomycetes bacterium]|nr:hypothetical protein [Planctomycetota bacterium]